MNNADLWTSTRFFERLDAFLLSRNWKLTDLGVSADITTQSLYAMRKRKTLPSLTSLCAICDALGISLADFFSVESDESPAELVIKQRVKEITPEATDALAALMMHLT